MKIVLFSIWYSPEPRPLIADLAQGLVQHNHEVTVVTGFPNWPTGKLYKGYSLKLWQKETIEGVSVVRVPLFPDHSKSFLARLLNYSTWIVAAVILTPLMVQRPHVVYAIQPIPAGLCAACLSVLWRSVYVVEIQDLWPESLAATGFVRNRGLLRLVRWIIHQILARASAIRVISTGFKRHLEADGLRHNRLVVIPNWVDRQSAVLATTIADATPPQTRSEVLHLLYAGSMGPAQDLATVIRCAQWLENTEKVFFTLAGDGIEREALETKVNQLGLHNVRFVGWLSGPAYHELLQKTDAFLIHLKDDPLFRVTIPHKVYSYLAMGKPIIAAVSGETAEIVTRSHAGFACSPGDEKAMAEAIKALIDMGQTGRDNLGKNGKRTALTVYCHSKLIKEIERLLCAAAFAS